MGCYFWAIIEYEASSQWYSFNTAGLFLPRQAVFFDALAGFHGGTPLFPPHGLPPKFSKAVLEGLFIEVIEEALGDFEWLQNHDLVTRKIADAWVAEGRSYYIHYEDYFTDQLLTGPFVSHPDAYLIGWLNYEEIKLALQHAGLRIKHTTTEFQSLMATLRVLTKGYGVEKARLVFWFT